jgi:ATP-dependent RNA helicase DeaD
VRARDRERLIEALLAPIEHDEEDIELGRRLLAERAPEDIAAALVRAHRATMPLPEELIDNGPPPRRERGERAEREPRERGGHRDGFDDSVWFRLNIGRRHNADPRWILPLLCRRGHVTKHEIGAIRIGPNETLFNIPLAIADRFAEAVERSANKDGEDDNGVAITPAPGGATWPPRREGGPRKDGPRKPHGKPGGFKAKPFGKGKPRAPR